jgi:transcriptional regulator with XRE-family HTH domain
MTTLAELGDRLRTRRDLPPPEMRRALRRAAGASLEDVARVVGVTRQAVALWESGAREPRGENLNSYADVLRMFREEVGESR